VGLFRRAKREPARRTGADRYALPQPTRGGRKGPTDQDFIEAAVAQAETRPPDDAFIELVGEGYAPPAYIWPVAFTRKPLDFWGDDNLARCADALRSSAFDSTTHCGQMLTKLEALDQGEKISGQELIQLQVPYSMTLLEALIDSSHHVLADDQDRRSGMEHWAAKKRSEGKSVVLTAHFDDALAEFTELVHLGAARFDLRIQIDFQEGPDGELDAYTWNRESLAEVYTATIRLLNLEVHKVANELREH
jgi:hypothetical protein